MSKINLKRVVISALVGGTIIWLLIPLIVNSIAKPKAENIQPVITDETAKAKLYLYESVNYNYAKFRLLKRIAECESRWDLKAINKKTNDYGVFQINQVWDKKAKELGLENYKTDWKQNIDLALWIYKNDKRGIKNWSWSYKCHKNGNS